MSLDARRTARLAALTALAVVLQIAESLIPKPLPWLRLGLANGAALLALVRLGVGAAVTLTVIRVVLGGLLLGTLGGPAFLLSATGSGAAVAVMAVADRAARPPLSLLGVSVLGAAAHGAGQLAAFALVFSAGSGAIALAPVLTAAAVPLGLITGGVVLAVHRRLEEW
jgi:heptaprenyl diphosphate synthase